MKVLISTLLFSVGLSAFAQTASDIEFQKRRSIAIQIFDATQAEQTMTQIISQSTNGVRAMLESSPRTKNLPPEAYEKLQNFSKKLAENFKTALTQPAVKDEMFGSMFNAYAELFTLRELEQVLAFYNSPIGQKFIAEQANALPRIAPQMQQSIAKVLNPIMSATAKEVGLEK